MPDRYWVGGTGTWNNSSTANWSDSDGGASGSSAPTTADNVFFTNSSGAADFTVTLAAATAVSCANFSCTTSNKKMTLSAGSGASMTVAGSWTNPSTTYMAMGIFSTITFTSSSAVTIDFNNLTLNASFTFNGSGSWQLQNNITSTTTSILTLTQGTLDLNSKTITIGSVTSNNTNTRAISFGSTGEIVITRTTTGTVWVFNNATNFTYTGSGKVSSTYSGALAMNYYHGTTAGATEANTPNFYLTAGTYAADFGNVKDLVTTGFTGSIASTNKTIYGNLTIGSGTTVTGGATTLTYAATSGTQNITTNGVAMNVNHTFSGVGGTRKLVDSLTTSRAIVFTGGALDLNGQTLTSSTFTTSGANVRSIAFSSGAISVSSSGSAFAATGSNHTNSGSGTITLTSASAKTFTGGGLSWPTLNQGGAGALTVAGSNTFADITNTYKATGATTITFTAGTTQTVTQFTASGESGRVLTLNSSSAGNQFTLSDANGTNSVSFCSIEDSIATGGAFWQAFTSSGNVDDGNNAGWIFSSVPVTYSQTTGVKLRSFAQRGRF
jgi:hypothetical protein